MIHSLSNITYLLNLNTFLPHENNLQSLASPKMLNTTTKGRAWQREETTSHPALFLSPPISSSFSSPPDRSGLYSAQPASGKVCLHGDRSRTKHAEPLDRVSRVGQGSSPEVQILLHNKARMDNHCSEWKKKLYLNASSIWAHASKNRWECM